MGNVEKNERTREGEKLVKTQQMQEDGGEIEKNTRVEQENRESEKSKGMQRKGAGETRGEAVSDKKIDAGKLLLEYPNLQKIFKYLDWQILRGRRTCDGENREKLLDERNKLLQIAKEMDLRDLRILYYVKRIESLGKSKTLRLLKNLYEAERRFKQELSRQ